MFNRVLISVFGIPLLAYIYYYGGIPLLIFINLIVGVGLYEFFTMAEKSEKKVYKYIGIFTGLLIPNLTYLKINSNINIEKVDILIILTIVLMGYRVFKNKVENTSTEISVTLIGIIYVSCFLSYMLLIGSFPQGGKILLILQVLVWICDTFAYFIGIKFGRKIFKRGFSKISPKKSIEGAIGGTFFTVITLILINKYLNIFIGEFIILKLVFMGVLISFFIQIGDLAESMFKREFKIKDSGRILGNHGGILDRFDSFIFVIPVAYYSLKYLMLY
ncbi:MAG: phosphatidate cytidylyltransferase [Fusobacteriaceae bacterium]